MQKKYYQTALTSSDVSDPAILLARLGNKRAMHLWCAIRANVDSGNKLRIMNIELMNMINTDPEYHVHMHAPDMSTCIDKLMNSNMIMVGKYHEIFLNPHYWWFGDPDKRHTARVEWDERKEQQNGGNRWLK